MLRRMILAGASYVRNLQPNWDSDNLPDNLGAMPFTNQVIYSFQSFENLRFILS